MVIAIRTAYTSGNQLSLSLRIPRTTRRTVHGTQLAENEPLLTDSNGSQNCLWNTARDKYRLSVYPSPDDDISLV